jgi:hypothetical protein
MDASGDYPPVETEEEDDFVATMWVDDAQFSVFLLTHQFELGCWRTAPHY